MSTVSHVRRLGRALLERLREEPKVPQGQATNTAIQACLSHPSDPPNRAPAVAAREPLARWIARHNDRPRPTVDGQVLAADRCER